MTVSSVGQAHGCSGFGRPCLLDSGGDARRAGIVGNVVSGVILSVRTFARARRPHGYAAGFAE